ncbi:Putative uncharacterized protein [Taphrina deformans PYCC 5710]|uniref:Enoyl reductase (ER) domain-containing protein n=1 Tax=Taphrina deformans (strain PYCC 5710 / ATCC 11124 / CBS 356.35 / IMI 108563 / JCM 9778 / NBRC 8474) TaxID=1097556 RepID=R4XCW6_TAPDE|nr:Putative uncharacterized protein [Taphrina deformans PYCC 5710]|eukprot:CCG82253.1 Putative uncharacterized protein [Taphrina deformans PYCC 5710]
MGVYDVQIKSECCGVCSSDVHTISGGWSSDVPVPLCVGHEVVGKVEKVGSKVTDFKVGDRAGVGAQVWSCLVCKLCKENNENYCPHQVDTYGAPYPTEKEAAEFGVTNGKELGLDGTKSQGGYSSRIRAHQRFVFPIPDALSSVDAAPLMCAGLTVYSPLVRNRVGQEGVKNVAIAGVGGLGHYAVQFAKALGAHVTVLTHSPSKEADVREMGADDVVLTNKEGWESDYAMKFDFILSTIDDSRGQTLPAFTSTLRVGGTYHSVGLPDKEVPVKFQMFAGNMSAISGSHIGSKAEVIEMLKLVVDKKIKSWTMPIPISPEGCSEAVTRVHDNNNVKYRIVLTSFDKAFGA